MYGYVVGDPVNRTDPEGMWVFPWELLDLWSYQQSSGEFAAAVEKLFEAPSWSRGFSAAATLMTATADAASLLLPAVPAVGGHIQGATRPIAGFLSSGKRVPNATGEIVSSVTSKDEIYYRVFSSGSPTGSFLTRRAPVDSATAVESFALQPGNTAECLQAVLVPAGTRLQRSIAGAAFGHLGGAEQFELLQKIPDEAFGPCVRLP
jgi:hypothetical protein